jgi:hypothetical protein
VAGTCSPSAFCEGIRAGDSQQIESLSVDAARISAVGDDLQIFPRHQEYVAIDRDVAD